jgi:hypothetical protein
MSRPKTHNLLLTFAATAPLLAAAASPTAGTATPWALAPVSAPVPPVASGTWARNEIDRFIGAALTADGLAPSPEASRRTLLRRLSFDLTGLPPTPEAVAAFEADTRPDAYERAADELLASPAHGERWARHWLDVARYADSNGLDENTAFANAWRYRDWVVRALNANIPVDRFMRMQVAGDLMPEAQDPAQAADQLAATGFLVLGPKVLAEPDKEKLVYDLVDEQVDVLSKAFLAQSVACARCHDHKFDPISQADYFALAGILKSTQTMASVATVARALERESDTDAHVADRTAREQAARTAKEAHGHARAEASWPLQDAWIEALPAIVTAAEACGGDASRAAELAAPLGVPPALLVQVHGAMATSPLFAWWRGEQAGPYREREEELQSIAHAALAARDAWREKRTKVHADGGVPGLDDAGLQAMRHALVDTKGLFELGNSLDAAFPAETRERLAALAAERDRTEALRLPAKPSVLAVRDTEKPTDLAIHARGDHMKPTGEPIPRGVPRVLAATLPMPAIPATGSGRMQLAQWLTAPEHPLTARVFVNRVWHWHFGQGLVDTPSDFGTRGSAPSNAALLDWLARDFVTHGWDLRRLHRQIVTSSTYRQASEARTDAIARDPGNRLLWRWTPRRLEAEAIRDTVLAVSGALDSTVGGSLLTTNNFDYVTNDQSANGVNYMASRRSLYLPVIRNAIFPFFATFDYTDASISVAARPRTVIAPQALYMLNSPFMRDESNRWAARLRTAVPAVHAEPAPDTSADTAPTYAEAMSPARTASNRAPDTAIDRIRLAYAQAFERAPTERETAAGLQFLASQSGLGEDGAWAAYAQALMSSSEFITVE